MRTSRLAAALLLIMLLGAAGCGGDDSASPAAGDCADVDAPAPRDPGTFDAPEQLLPTNVRHTLTFTTSCGTFTIDLTPNTAPRATASLVALAEADYFDDTVFHRIVPGFVIQGGDPTQTGGGGPGYTTVDPPPSDARYVRGTVAMAKTLDEPPGAAGSQFFVVTADDAGLPPDYAIVGTVSGDGLQVVERIGELGDESELPTRTVRVEDVAVGP